MAPVRIFSPSFNSASWDRIPNVCAPSRPYDRFCDHPHEFPSDSRTAHTPASLSRPRRTAISYGSGPHRRTPPAAPAERSPFVRTERTASALLAHLDSSDGTLRALSQTTSLPLDPFADDLLSLDMPLASRPHPRVSLPSHSTPNADPDAGTQTLVKLSVPPGLARNSSTSKDILNRRVATVLLSRTGGRPLGEYLRRRLSGEAFVHVKSGLSQLVACAA